MENEGTSTETSPLRSVPRVRESLNNSCRFDDRFFMPEIQINQSSHIHSKFHSAKMSYFTGFAIECGQCVMPNSNFWQVERTARDFRRKSRCNHVKKASLYGERAINGKNVFLGIKDSVVSICRLL